MSRKSRKLLKGLASITADWPPVETSDIESTYVAKPRYHHKRKSGKLVRWFAYITSDLSRLTIFTLIVVLVCGLGTVAALSLLTSRSTPPVIINETSAADDSSLNPENDLQSNTQDEQIPITRTISDASAERSVLAGKRSDNQSDSQVDHIEHSSRSPDVKPLRASSERIGRDQHATTSKQETPRGARSVDSLKSDRASVKSVPSTNVASGEQENRSGTKAPLSTFAQKPSSKTQRPRRVRNDRAVPAAAAAKDTKPKVIQWP